MKPALLLIATALSLIGTADYILSITRRKTRPHRTTRTVLFMVSIANLVGSFGAHAHGGVLLLSFIFFARSLTLALLSLKFGVGGTSKLDIVCGAIAILGIVAWLITGSGIWALAFSIIADAVAYVPAVFKTWRSPKSEAPLMYTLEGVAAILAVVHDGLLLSTIFQIYIVLSCVVMLSCIYRPSFGREHTTV